MKKLILIAALFLIAPNVAQANDRTLHRCRQHHSHHYCRKHHFHHSRHRKANTVNHPATGWGTGTASWYDDSGTHCCGYYAHYGFADCANYTDHCWPMGTKVEFCYQRCVVATADDHGPYVAGRDFDFNQNTAEATGLASAGVAKVRYRVISYG